MCGWGEKIIPSLGPLISRFSSRLNKCEVISPHKPVMLPRGGHSSSMRRLERSRDKNFSCHVLDCLSRLSHGSSIYVEQSRKSSETSLMMIHAAISLCRFMVASSIEDSGPDMLDLYASQSFRHQDWLESFLGIGEFWRFVKVGIAVVTLGLAQASRDRQG